MNNFLLNKCINHSGNWDTIYNTLNIREPKSKEKIKCNYLTILNPNYPIHLRNIYKPPFVIFFDGDLSLFNNKLITIVGRIEKYNLDFLKTLNNLGYVFIYQVNDQTFSSAKKLVRLNYKTIFILCDGLDNKINACLCSENTLLISEYWNSDINRSNDQHPSRLSLGCKHDILFIDYDEIEQHADELSICKKENNNIYKIVYRTDKNIINKWQEHNAILIKNVSALRTIFDGSLTLC